MRPETPGEVQTGRRPWGSSASLDPFTLSSVGSGAVLFCSSTRGAVAQDRDASLSSSTGGTLEGLMEQVPLSPGEAEGWLWTRA